MIASPTAPPVQSGTNARLTVLSKILDKHLPVVADSIFARMPNRVPVEIIQHCVARSAGIRYEHLVGGKRAASYARPRPVAMYLCRELSDASFSELARSFSKRDHTTIMYGYRRVKTLIEESTDFAKEIEALVDTIRLVQADLKAEIGAHASTVDGHGHAAGVAVVV